LLTFGKELNSGISSTKAFYTCPVFTKHPTEPPRRLLANDFVVTSACVNCPVPLLKGVPSSLCKAYGVDLSLDLISFLHFYVSSQIANDGAIFYV